ncbi:MAG TPA: nitrous oxide reductase family maturation protein NosD [Blastocatellia bacterium]|nr:nitrous oxide reductase family maturation protein NosD [Blastocatellia bacterium]
MQCLIVRTAVLLGLAVVACATRASADVLTVDESAAKFPTISAAIAAAHPGDTIQVHGGSYLGPVVIEKKLNLEGIGKPILRGAGQGSVLTVLADGCVIKGFIVEHCGDDLQNEDSGILLKSRDNIIEDNELRDILYGIYLYRSPGNTIRRNAIRGRAELEIGERGAGLHLWDSPDNTIEDNTISEARDGLYIQSCDRNTIRRNSVFKLRYGVHYMFSNWNKFEDNIFSNNVAGAAIMYSDHIEFRRNAFIHNRGFSSFGILFQECNDCFAEENFIIDNDTGIFMEALRTSTFRSNVIAENDVALQMFSSADYNTFTANNFVENLSPLQLIGRSTTTHWADNGRGNFWSDYDGYDLNGDGIGDVPHKVQNVFEYMEGRYPRLRIYLNSPVAQALSMAEKILPLVKGSSEADTAPLMKASALRYPFDDPRPKRSVHVMLAIVSLAMLSAVLIVIYETRRKLLSH